MNQTASTSKKTSAKDKILSCALELFNKQGTSAISTNHIAKSASISPGNLYYHFKNKEEIILNIYLSMNFECQDCMEKRQLQTLSNLEELNEYLSQLLEIQWKYLFLSREFPALIAQDPNLNEVFQKVQEQRLQDITQDIQNSVDAGFLIPMPPEDVEALVQAIWMSALFWTPFAASRGGELTKEQMAGGHKMMQFLLKPYLSITP
ncbi:MAG: TetR/AcrR family transcriptional regulator [SAR324 cluster bacterium]|nr:TetR/AcrR family transcriptional regulator [SAR324 cluster bacterium]